jgi:hypothetical protein
VLAVARVSKLKALKEIFGKKGFWDFRPFTRVVKDWRGFKIASDYVVLNKLEAVGIVPKRDGRLKDVLPGEFGYFRENRGAGKSGRISFR